MKHLATLAYLAATWPHTPLTEQGAREFDAALAELDPAEALAAARHFYATDPKGFRPTPGQIRAIVKPKDPGAAERAWTSVTKAIAHYAGKPTHETPTMPSFGDPLTSKALESIGGFRQFLGGLSSERAEFTRGRFLRAYRDAVTGGAPLLRLPNETKRLEAREMKGGAR